INLFHNNINSFLLILFPELKFILLRIVQFKSLHFIYRRYHLFLSILIFKFNYLLPKLKHELMNLKANGLITDSKFINLFVLETRCFMCVFSLTLFEDRNCVKLFFLKAFLCYVRCCSFRLLDYFLIDEYTIFDNFDGYSDQISIDFVCVFNFLRPNYELLDFLPKCDIIFLNSDLFSKEFTKLTKLEKIEKLYRLSSVKNTSLDNFKMRNNAVMLKIRNALEKVIDEIL
ncbi:hypothetical protein TUBRATIS_27170, partial [Tubulinosema ratisbonensis]